MNFLVLGLGNLLMNDDAAGLHAVYALQRRFPDTENFQVVDGGTLGLDLLGYIAWADNLLIIDAIDIEAEPGTVALIEGDDIDLVFDRQVSLHQMGLKDMLAVSELTDDKPARVSLLGIQAKDISMSMELTPAVKKGLDKLVKEATAIITRTFQQQADRPI